MLRRPGFLSAVVAIFALLCGSALGQVPCKQITTFADGLIPTSEIHVAPNGSNGTGNGSLANPYATVQFAAGKAAPGAAVVVHAGTYAGGEFIWELHGQPGKPIWIGGAPGEPRPVFDGGGSVVQALHLVRPRYVIVHNLEVRNFSGNGINCDDGGDYANPDAARYVIFRNLLIHDIGGSGNQDGLKLSGLNDFFVLDCEISKCGGAASGSGIDMVGCHAGLIARCYLHDLSANAVQAKGGTQDVEVRWCRMVEAGQRSVNIGGSTGFEFFRPPLSASQPNYEAKDVRAVANVIEGAAASVAFVGCVQCVVADNTIVTPHNWILRILQETVSTPPYTFLACGDNRFENNLVYFDRSDLSTYVNIGANTAPQTFQFAHNLWYAYDNPAQSMPTLPVPEVGGIYGVNPKLKNPAAKDYSIGPDSPASGKGKPPASAKADIAGVCYRSPPAIGAYEIPCVGDITGDGVVDQADLGALLTAYGKCEGQAGYNPAANLAATPGGPQCIEQADLGALLAVYGANCL